MIWLAVEQCVVINQNVLELFKNNSWLRRFFCQLTHRWPGEYWRVVSCGLPVIAVVLFLSLFIYGRCHAHNACRVIKQNQANCFYETKLRSRVTIILLPARHSIFHLQGRQLCNSSGKISNGHLACSRDTKEKRCSDKNNAKILDGRKTIL